MTDTPHAPPPPEKTYTVQFRFPHAEDIGCGCFLVMLGLGLFSGAIVSIIEAIKK